MSKRTLPAAALAEQISPPVTKAQIDAFKISLQEDVRGDAAKTRARCCVGSAEDIATHIANNDSFRFVGSLINASDWFWESKILSMGVNEEEMRRRMTAARNMIIFGKIEGSGN